MAKNQKPKSPARDEDESVSLPPSAKGTSAAQPPKPAPDFCQPDHPAACPLGAAMFSEPAWREIARSLNFSGQQLQIVQGIFDDYTEAAIAAHLQVSPHTVHTYCERLYHKLGVTGRVRLALRVIAEYIALTLAPGTVLPPLCANFAAGRCPLRRK